MVMGDRANPQFVVPGGLDSSGAFQAGATAPATQWQAAISDAVNTSVPLKAAAGAGLRNYITDLTISNSSAAAVLVQLLDGVTVVWQANIPAGGFVDTDLQTPLKSSANTALNILAAVATVTLYVNASGYTAV